jgi:TetR/AcrR family transcriptional regulator, transcriptional repressor for nem operon
VRATRWCPPRTRSTSTGDSRTASSSSIPTALLDEIGRSTDATRQAYTDGPLAVIDDITARLDPDDPLSARAKTLSVFDRVAG